jgi:enoyl-[acyl-carrier-protein] reductase (NADH)
MNPENPLPLYASITANLCDKSHYTSLSALNREVKRSDIAASTVFLVSEAARCITGQTLVVDSGQAMVR